MKDRTMGNVQNCDSYIKVLRCGLSLTASVWSAINDFCEHNIERSGSINISRTIEQPPASQEELCSMGFCERRRLWGM
jgi:hypothetical protein